MKTKVLAINGVIAALYIAISTLIIPIAFGPIQFRIPEIFNHLIVFNKKYFFGIVVGVFITNLFSELGSLDLIFGLAHSILSLLIIILLSRVIKNKWILLFANTFVFTFNMFIIAYELNIAFKLPFLLTWLTTAAGEFIIMAIGMPLMYAMDKKINFKKLID
ncbi:QueT transporter family protein [Cerasibacillus terrae]|uniref:QueT transporter family protein n=1 Tax=Cerasibacillus terrae TaxID=2498845 RepID=A0A5C8NSU7_9BACI|nr:QueT transporter family protein [Cerasibacillus terrae]TXL63935.1 QueT transporter family protein [Cerasibacillus terrae]